MFQDMESSPLDGEIPRYMTAGVALFEMVDDELLPIKPLGIQVKGSFAIRVPQTRLQAFLFCSSFFRLQTYRQCLEFSWGTCAQFSASGEMLSLAPRNRD